MQKYISPSLLIMTNVIHALDSNHEYVNMKDFTLVNCNKLM